jgi:hypothetical protein
VVDRAYGRTGRLVGMTDRPAGGRRMKFGARSTSADSMEAEPLPDMVNSVNLPKVYLVRDGVGNGLASFVEAVRTERTTHLRATQ